MTMQARQDWGTGMLELQPHKGAKKGKAIHIDLKDGKHESLDLKTSVDEFSSSDYSTSKEELTVTNESDISQAEIMGVVLTNPAMSSDGLQAVMMEEQHSEGSLPACSSSASRYCKSLQELDFRRLSIIPLRQELFGELLWQQDDQLPTNKVCGEKYESISEYLATHFLLLREDCLHSLRQGIQAMSQNKRPADRLDLQVYRDARLHSICCGKFGMEHRLSFPKGNCFTENSGISKCLREGSLICMSDDGFQTLIWGTVSRHIKPSIDGDITQIKVLDDVGDVKQFSYKTRYMVMESPAAFFEAYCHVLRNLQKPDMNHLPFGEHLVFLEPHVAAPDYLPSEIGEQNAEYDFFSVFPEMENQLGSCAFPVLQEWPKWKSSLDPSQMEAVKHGITKRLALIQGPPGTGKTFVGTVIINILLNNLWTPTRALLDRDLDLHQDKRTKIEDQKQMDAPLLVLCYTNHALDQFLEGVFEFEENLIRYGGRSTSSKLASCTVKQRLKKGRRGILKSVWNRHRSICRQSDMLRVEISRCHAILRLDHVTFEPLREVATQEQMENLYMCGSSSRVIQLWLQGLDMQSAYRCMQGEEHENLAPVANEGVCGEPASVLEEESGENSEDFDLEEPYVWTLEKSSRIALHSEWLKRIIINAEKKLHKLTADYQSLCARRTKTDEDIQYSALKSARVVGMTTTAAARCHGILMRLRPKVVIVEEAAEILEGHIIACLTPFTEHLILIGDHLQLRPSVAVNKLAADHSLDVSLFERLVSGGVEKVTLKFQRRMRPCISRLLRSIYPALKDHDSVFGRKNVEGLSKNVFFLDHRWQERCALGSRSKVNHEESLFIVELYLYVLKQGSYKTSDVTILTMYRAQMECIKNMLQERVEYSHSLPANVVKALLGAPAQVTSVDDFQGEESNIIILSLVRNLCSEKDAESIGFLESSHRICVALSRARDGLYILGNADLLSSKSELWQAIVDDMRSSKSIGSFLTLVCPNHFPGLETEIHEAKDFGKVVDGGCGQRCNHRLDCGHLCPRSCHPGDHAQVACLQRCLSLLQCGHPCWQKCHGTTKCPPCQQKVSRLHPRCHHQTLIACSRPMGIQCEEPCNFTLMCGHKCANKCGQKCTYWCTRQVEKTLPCGHAAFLPCYQQADSVASHVKKFFPVDISANLYAIKHASHAQDLARTYAVIDDANGNVEICASLVKSFVSGIVSTSNVALNVIRCRICNPNIVEICSQLPLKEMEASTCFVELVDCGHLAEYNMLDAWIDTGEPASSIWPKTCPKCGTPIRRTVRYRAVINSILMKLEKCKKLIIDNNHWANSRHAL
ncbi:hypothetical protein L7F22_024792 [Adiantum nelumboides]|nr:hypothetical protein [Adiantum nelumboides]